MGPRSRDRGKCKIARSWSMPPDASMGPRSRDRGKRGRLPDAHGNSSTLQWGRGHVTAESSDASCSPVSQRRACASMGPRSRDRGKSAPRCATGVAARWLQWGRGHVTAESRAVVPDAVARPCASMGPRSRDRGKSSVAASAELERRELQWGRGHVTAESALQRCRCVGSRLAAASMGPRSRDRGKCQSRSGQSAARTLASMGPRSRDRGKLTRSRVAAELSRMLQWGRGHVTAERRGGADAAACRTGFNGAAVT